MGLPLDLIFLGIDTGLTLLFYKLYRSSCSNAELVEKAELVDLTPDLAQMLEEIPDRTLAYACVSGVVEPVNKALHSFYTEDTGVAHNIIFKEHKTKRTQGFWHDFVNTIRDHTNWVPFTLKNKDSGNTAIHVTEPGSAKYLDFSTTYDKFEPNQTGILERGLDRLFGDVSKGFQETESMLKVGATLLGVGKIALEDGKLKLKPSPDKLYILTELSKEEVLSKLRSNSTVFKVFTYILGISSVVILVIALRHRLRDFLSRRNFNEQLRTIRDAIRRHRNDDVDGGERENAENDGQNCVICLTNPREVVLLECGHICLCADCVEKLPTPRLCPVCRQHVIRVVPTYMP